MRDIVAGIAAWYEQGNRFALATVVRTWQSSPRQPGAAMAVSGTGEVIGSVSGGCVEGAVYELANQVLQTRTPVLQTYGVSDEDALTVGLTCGGTLQVFIEPIDEASFPQLSEVAAAAGQEHPVAVCTLIEGYGRLGTHLVIDAADPSNRNESTAFDRAVSAQAVGMLEVGKTGVLQLGRNGEQRMDEVSVFVESFSAPPRMLVFGAIDFAAAVARMGKFLGFHVTVCDARPVFATRKRFPDADEVIVDWPHRFLARTNVDPRTVICILTHDPKFDVPLLEVALRTPAGYIGAMGSRRTHDDRINRLREAGVDEASLSRLSSPIGLDLGARTPEETAVAIAAEIVADTWGGTTRRLKEIELAIHR